MPAKKFFFLLFLTAKVLELLHIKWGQRSSVVDVVNISLGARAGINVRTYVGGTIDTIYFAWIGN